MMKRILFAWVFIMSAYCLSCQPQPNNLKHNTLEKVGYSSIEIFELIQIASAFDSLINHAFINSDSTTSFQYFCNYINSEEEDDPLAFYSPFRVDSLRAIFFRIRQMNIYADIWHEVSYYDSKDAETVIGTSLAYNLSGKFLKFIKSTDSKYNRSPYYYSSIIRSGDGSIVPTFYFGFQNYAYNKYDKYPDFQLVCAVHYFTMIFNILEREGMMSIK
ncbi:hypothetical protein DSECCO2_535300 [anaerobic digester metagenome]